MPIERTRSSACHLPGPLQAIVLAAVLWYPGGAQAGSEDPGVSIFSLHGFGTLGMVHADARDADFVGTPFQPDGAGYTRAWAPGVDSKLGLQAGAQVTGKLSAIVQVVSQHLYDGSWGPRIEWANVKYEVTPDFSIRAGRSVAAPFIFSDTRLVAYTYPWVRPPAELYDELPITNIDGVDIRYRLHVGVATHSLSVTYGQTDLKITGDGVITARDVVQVSDVMESGPLTLRLGYTSFRARIDEPGFEALFSGFTQFGAAASSFGLITAGAQATALVGTYSSRFSSSFSYSVATVGASYDPGDWLLMSEWVRSTSDGALASSTAWYVTGGYRFGRFTPYLTLARIAARTTIEPGIATAGLPPPLAAAATALNAGLTAQLQRFAPSQSSASAGLRWDVVKSVDLKLQYDRMRLDANSSGRLMNLQPGFQPADDVNVFSVAMDFVF